MSVDILMKAAEDERFNAAFAATRPVMGIGPLFTTDPNANYSPLEQLVNGRYLGVDYGDIDADNPFPNINDEWGHLVVSHAYVEDYVKLLTEITNSLHDVSLFRDPTAQALIKPYNQTWDNEETLGYEATRNQRYAISGNLKRILSRLPESKITFPRESIDANLNEMRDALNLALQSAQDTNSFVSSESIRNTKREACQKALELISNLKDTVAKNLAPIQETYKSIGAPHDATASYVDLINYVGEALSQEIDYLANGVQAAQEQVVGKAKS